MSVPQPPGLDIRFTLTRVSFLNNLDQWIDVPLETEIKPERLVVNQIKIAEFGLIPGQYTKVKIVVSDPVLKLDQELISLTGPEIAAEVVNDLKFSLSRGESLALFFEYRPDESMSGQDEFAPVISVMLQGMELRDQLLYVSCSRSNSIIILDRQQDRVVGAAGVGRDPTGIVVGLNNDRVYVANRGSNNISVVNTISNKVEKTISNLGYSPYQLALSRDGRRLFVTNSMHDNVTVIDTSRDLVVETISVERNPTGIVHDPDRNLIYVANTNSNTISVIDVSSLQVVRTVPVDDLPVGVAVQEDKIYVANRGSSNITVIDLPSYKVEKSMPVGSGPSWVISGPRDIIYLSRDYSNEIHVIYTPMSLVTHTISVGQGPVHMYKDSWQRKLYVVNHKSDDITVIDMLTKKAIRNIQVGHRPQFIAAIEK